MEAHRAPDGLQRSLGQTFANWGIPTALAIADVRNHNPDGLIIASGGLRNGLDAAKAIALGADLVSYAQPILSAALNSADEVANTLQLLIEELKASCFLTGSRTALDLRAPEKRNR